jgi:hypothetical protein
LSRYFFAAVAGGWTLDGWLETVFGGVALWLVVGRKPPMMPEGLVVKPSIAIRLTVVVFFGASAITSPSSG